MRQFLPLIIPVLLLACSQKKQTPVDMGLYGNQVDSIRKVNLTKNIDSTFLLGFKAGIDSVEYGRHVATMIEADLLRPFDKSGFSYLLKTDSATFDAQIVPIFERDRLQAIKLILWGNGGGMDSFWLKDYLTKKYGPYIKNRRSLESSLWVVGKMEVELNSELLQVDPSLSPLKHNTITYRSTAYSLRHEL